MADTGWNVGSQNVTPLSNKLYVYYRCSKCNQSNVFEHRITGQSTPEKLITKRNEILAKAKEYKYAPAAFRCKCEKCGHVENWSKYNPPGLEKCASINFILAILAAIGTVFGIVPWPLILTFLGVAVHACIISAIIDGARNKQVKAMDVKYLPIIATNMDELKVQVATAFPDGNAQNQQSARPQQQNNASVRQAVQPQFAPKQPEAAAPKFTPAAPQQPAAAAPKFTPAAPQQPAAAAPKFTPAAPQQPAAAAPKFTPAAPQQPAPARSAEISIADEILKFKGLLDAGIITREEFEAKKKQLLRM